jgi:hypothetical protein
VYVFGGVGPIPPLPPPQAASNGNIAIIATVNHIFFRLFMGTPSFELDWLNLLLISNSPATIFIDNRKRKIVQ